MSPAKLYDQLQPLRQQPPSVSLDQVTAWVRTGRNKPKFHALAWLSRVGWRFPN